MELAVKHHCCPLCDREFDTDELFNNFLDKLKDDAEEAGDATT